MKTYSDFIKEISSNELYEGLLGFGMFSEKIPPMFTSKSFYDYCKANSPTFEDKWHSFVRYDSVRNTNIIRELGIPTPMSYQQLCKCVEENWEQLTNHFFQNTNNQDYIVSRIHLRKMNNSKMLFKMNYDNWKEDGNPELDLLIGSKYIVHADVSKCFPSIYTHSLPWALVGKKEAKLHAGAKNKGLWYNQIDHYAQNCKYGETHGLLIGPHMSNLLGEIILTVVDKELYSKDWKFIRHIDDYTCYVDSFEKAHLFLIDLNTELRKFDLSINDKKTEISLLPKALTEQWIRQISNTKSFFRDGKFDYISAQSYFDNAIELMQKNNENSAILNYAIKALPIDVMTNQAKISCVKTIFHLCLLYPYLVQIIDEFVFQKFNVDKNEIECFSNKLFDQELKAKNFDAICYALFFARKYDFQINNLKAQDAIENESCIFKLLSFLYFKKNNNTAERACLRNHASELKKDTEEFDRNWLFVYETLPASDLSGDWKSLKTANISFIL